jgi:hypothetical protein
MSQPSPIKLRYFEADKMLQATGYREREPEKLF